MSMVNDVSVPLVSILVAYYNNLQHIEEAIRSAFCQTYKNIEVVVVDDCSPDPAARALIVELSEKYGFKLISKTRNEGASKAFQTAFEHCAGDYVSILSHDDIYRSNKIEVCMSAIREGGLDAVYCNGATFTTDANKAQAFNSDPIMSAFRRGQHGVAELISSADEFGSLLTQGALFSRRIMQELSWMREKFLLDDWPFTIKVWRDYKVGYVDEVVYLYRLHDDNVHKNYWKWFPARIQTIAELVHDERKTDGLSFIMNSMAGASKSNGRLDDAYRFALAGLALASSEDNVDSALRLIARLNRSISKSTKEAATHNFRAIFLRDTFLFKIYNVLLKILVSLVPLKRQRRALRERLNVF